MAGAAFFDLDRTLLGGASGPVISAALRKVGVLPEREIPGEKLVYGLFNIVGETLPSMLMARQAARVASGWNRKQVREAGELVAEALLDQIQPYAHVLIEEHRAHNRPVVMATTSPYDLVQPLADLLGLDGVLATKYAESSEGFYTGKLLEDFVWGRGKLRTVRRWARENNFVLDESYAYSDSVYDLPLLTAVGHPTAVNPDPRLWAYASLRRWPVTWLDAPPGVPKVLGYEPQEVLQMFARPELFPYVRFDIKGTENIPADGAAIIVGNHRSYFDPLAMGMTVAQAHRPVRFLGKKEVFDAPVVGPVATAMGGIRVDRGTGSDEPLEKAVRALKAGELVAIMPEGTIPRGPAFFDPELKGRWGAASLAAKAKVPVIPVGMWGTEKVWPRSSRAPKVWNLTDPPTITIRVGKPVADMKYRSADADTKRIMSAITALLPAEARKAKKPTAEELALTYPPGYAGDPKSESDRRPGTD